MLRKQKLERVLSSVQHFNNFIIISSKKKKKVTSMHFFTKPRLVQSWIQLTCEKTYGRFQFWPAHAPLLLPLLQCTGCNFTHWTFSSDKAVDCEGVQAHCFLLLFLPPFPCHSRTCPQLPTALSCLTTGPLSEAHSAPVPAWPVPVPIPSEVPRAPRLPCPWERHWLVALQEPLALTVKRKLKETSWESILQKQYIWNCEMFPLKFLIFNYV